MRGQTEMNDKIVQTTSRGQVLVLVALAMTVLLLFAGLVLDIGTWLVQERVMRNAADAGAQAGVSELVKKPITVAKQQNAATHAMEYLNDQLNLGLAAADIGTAATHAMGDANGFGSEDAVPGYAGLDHFVIRFPVTANLSCTGVAWGDRAITVRVQHAAPRFFTKLLFSGPQPVNVCATASLEGLGYAIAVLKPYGGGQPQSEVTMNLGGADTFLRICGGDVGVNSVFNANGQPGNQFQQPAYIKFMKPNSVPACDIDNNNKLRTTLENAGTWSTSAKQVRTEGPTSVEPDDLYYPPIHLTNYILIPSWGATYYAALNDAAQPTLRLTAGDAGLGTCTPPSGYDAVEPGKYNLIATGASVGQKSLRWLCPGVFHFVPTNGQQGVQLGSNTTLAGQGVTLVFETGPNHNRDDSVLSVAAGGNLLLNCLTTAPHNCPGARQEDAQWRTGDPRHDAPITVWIKPDASCPTAPTLSCSPSSVFNMGSGSGLDVKGIIFGPTDKMKIAGNGSHHGAGEIWAWTIEYVGNSQLDQRYEGDDEGYPLIVE
jgi:Flp pilus assembly protein TadG